MTIIVLYRHPMFLDRLLRTASEAILSILNTYCNLSSCSSMCEIPFVFICMYIGRVLNHCTLQQFKACQYPSRQHSHSPSLLTSLLKRKQCAPLWTLQILKRHSRAYEPFDIFRHKYMHFELKHFDIKKPYC